MIKTSSDRKEIKETAVEIVKTENDGSLVQPKMILASASPRRREILSKLGIPFEVIVSGADENSSASDPRELVKELALLKAKDVFNKFNRQENVLVIGSDTVVDLNGRILGKPHDRTEADEMLKGLSGNSHKVHTGIAVIVRDRSGNITEYNEAETSVVNVDTLAPEEIEAYIESGEPFDKAGSYAIQGLFAPYISSIEGDYYNIVGLPLNRLYRILKKYYR
ncbi:MAG: Maf family protein [Lachnospiraceae bacterium]|nr:Maf family protein [Lachnospiraceae bacterium]